MAIPSEQDTLEMLDREPKVRIRITGDKNNPNYVTERVYINGACIQIPVGEPVDVPQTVAKILEDKGII